MCDQETLTKVHLVDNEREKERRQGCVKVEKKLPVCQIIWTYGREKAARNIEKFIEREDDWGVWRSEGEREAFVAGFKG